MLKSSSVAGSNIEKETEVAVFPGGVMTTYDIYNLILDFVISF